MRQDSFEVRYEVTLECGERLTLPRSVADAIGEGHWLVTIRSVSRPPVRDHSAFLSSYVKEDEGLYDDCQPG